MKIAIMNLLVVATLLSFAGCAGTSDLSSPVAYHRGTKDGKEELKKGALAVESFGLLAPWTPIYSRILKERYGVEERIVAGCSVDSDIIGHADGFNTVMERAITEKYGKDVFAEAATEARSEYNMKKQNKS